MKTKPKPKPKPINISPELAARRERPDAGDRMDQIFRAVINAKPSDVAKQEEKWRQVRAKSKQ
jgi:hypothetical protein